MSDEQSAGVTVIYGGAPGKSVNFPKANYVLVDPQGALTVLLNREQEVAIFSAGSWSRAFNLGADQPKAVANPLSH